MNYLTCILDLITSNGYIEPHILTPPTPPAIIVLTRPKEIHGFRRFVMSRTTSTVLLQCTGLVNITSHHFLYQVKIVAI